MRPLHIASPVRPLLCLASLTLLSACPEPVDDGPDPDPDPACVDDDACDAACGAAVVDACGVPVACPCRTDEETDALLGAADEALALLLDSSYMQDVIDLDPIALLNLARFRVQHTDGPPALAELAGARAVVQGFRNGHSGLFRTDVACRDLGAADLGETSYGVCAAPADDGFVITHQPGAANPLGLAVGERVVGWNGHRGASLVDAILAEPICGNVPGHDDGRLDHAAAALFSVVRAGDVLDVEGVDGAARVVEVGATEVPWTQCRFPAGPNALPWIEASLRDDGILVVALRRFYLLAGEEGYVDVQTVADAEELIDNMIAQAAAVVADAADGARAVIWDARGNLGGASPVGFAIVAGMQGAVPTPIARCTTRIEGTDPVAYQALGPDYDIVPDDRVRVDLPAALLIDGMAISAADYFARATALAAPAVRIFGRPSAGAYGGGGLGTTLASAPNIYVAYDPYRCNDVDGTPLETIPTVPDERVNLDPADLAAGVDTVLERAATHLLANLD